ncbi:MAG: putative quinol monooxygenase [bacterium]|nr:putative quinol monooxygenase [bacterium]MCY4195141.1 putative quinol monooxygenase [bacterium]MCY4272255.1 putative quinol monooxygenase [bacterium]
MIVIAGTGALAPENTEAFMAAANEMAAASRAEEGNLEYCFSVEAPGKVRFFEIWESEEALGAHFAAPHMAAFGAAISELGITGMDGKKYEVASVSPLFG